MQIEAAVTRISQGAQNATVVVPLERTVEAAEEMVAMVAVEEEVVEDEVVPRLRAMVIGLAPIQRKFTNAISI